MLLIVLLNKWTISLMERFLNDIPKETVQLLFWFDQYLHVDNAISRVDKVEDTTPPDQT